MVHVWHLRARAHGRVRSGTKACMRRVGCQKSNQTGTRHSKRLSWPRRWVPASAAPSSRALSWRAWSVVESGHHPRCCETLFFFIFGTTNQTGRSPVCARGERSPAGPYITQPQPRNATRRPPGPLNLSPTNGSTLGSASRERVPRQAEPLTTWPPPDRGAQWAPTPAWFPRSTPPLPSAWSSSRRCWPPWICRCGGGTSARSR